MKKRILIVGAVVALVVAALVPAVVFAASTTDISGNITAKIDFSAPAVISNWTLAQGAAATNNKTGTLTVYSNKNWTASVVDADVTNTTGKMASYNGTGYDTGPIRLTNSLLIISAVPVGTGASSNGLRTLSTSSQDICSGNVTSQGAGDVGEGVTINFSQQIEYKDRWLNSATGHYYRIVVTFVATQI